MIRNRVELPYKKIFSVLGFSLFSVAIILILGISITSASFLRNFVMIRHADCSVRLGKLLSVRGRGVCLKSQGGTGIVVIGLMSALRR